MGIGWYVLFCLLLLLLWLGTEGGWEVALALLLFLGAVAVGIYANVWLHRLLGGGPVIAWLMIAFYVVAIFVIYWWRDRPEPPPPNVLPLKRCEHLLRADDYPADVTTALLEARRELHVHLVEVPELRTETIGLVFVRAADSYLYLKREKLADRDILGPEREHLQTVACAWQFGNRKIILSVDGESRPQLRVVPGGGLHPGTPDGLAELVAELRER